MSKASASHPLLNGECCNCELPVHVRPGGGFDCGHCGWSDTAQENYNRLFDSSDFYECEHCGDGIDYHDPELQWDCVRVCESCHADLLEGWINFLEMQANHD